MTICKLGAKEDLFVKILQHAWMLMVVLQHRGWESLVWEKKKDNCKSKVFEYPEKIGSSAQMA